MGTKGTQTQGEWNVEIQKITFSDSNEESVTFTNLHKRPPYVVGSPVDLQESGTEGQSNVNIFVSDVTANSCIVKSSSKFSGTVHLKIISIIS
jgi:hypothetical protein|tara:strand:- start:84 stop:362 length:279 start_codon:yes stop_codon:yes gene_type:complete